MAKKKSVITIILIVIIFGFFIVFFYPKKRVVGGFRGLVDPGQTLYREEFLCFGIKYDFCPPWPDYGCDYLCYGIVYNKKCFNEVYNPELGIQKIEIDCR